MLQLLSYIVSPFGLCSLSLPVFAHSGFCIWLVRISDESSLTGITLSDASTLYLVYYLIEVNMCYILKPDSSSDCCYSSFEQNNSEL